MTWHAAARLEPRNAEGARLRIAFVPDPARQRATASGDVALVRLRRGRRLGGLVLCRVGRAPLGRSRSTEGVREQDAAADLPLRVVARMSAGAELGRAEVSQPRDHLFS